MRDLVVREGLETMAFDAAELLRELIAAGGEIPYEVREPGDGSPLCRYEPLTEQFIRDHAAELRRLDSFGAACAAIEACGLAAPYLEDMGIGIPAEAGRRAELAGVVFLCRLWMDSVDFTLEDDRLEQAIAELEAQGELEDEQIEVIVPLRGLQMPVARLDLASASIVRSDTVEVPGEARVNDGLGLSPWEPPFLAIARVDPLDADAGRDAATLAVESFRLLVTTLRLFKAGGVGLGPYAWTRAAGDRWRRVATGAGRQRPGGYRLTEAELGDLSALSRALLSPSAPFARRAQGRPGFATALGRAINRFEAGLERNVVVEALNDHLLSLRFLLEGGGPAGLSLPMRVAALCAEPGGRTEIKATLDHAIALERELWSGEPAPRAAQGTPAETAAAVEEYARAIIKDGACGHLGSDLRATADEILLADGLAVGGGAGAELGGTTEWELEPAGEMAGELEALEREGFEDPGEPVASAGADGGEHALEPLEAFEALEPLESIASAEPPPEEGFELDARISPEPTTADASRPGARETLMIERARSILNGESEPATTSLELVPEPDRTDPSFRDERPAGDPADRPASPVLRLIEQTRAERRARTDRVAGLFPAPETTEWSIREIAYDRSRRAAPDGAEAS